MPQGCANPLIINKGEREMTMTKKYYSATCLYVKPDSVANVINSNLDDNSLGRILRRAAGLVVDELPNTSDEILAVCIRNDCEAYRTATERKNGTRKPAKGRADVAHPSNLPPVRPVGLSTDQSTYHPTEVDDSASILSLDSTSDGGSNLPAEVDAKFLECYGVGELGPNTPPLEVFYHVCERSLCIPQSDWTKQTESEIMRTYEAAILGKGASNTRRTTPIKNWIAYTVRCLIVSYEKGSLPQCKSKPRGLQIK